MLYQNDVPQVQQLQQEQRKRPMTSKQLARQYTREKKGQSLQKEQFKKETLIKYQNRKKREKKDNTQNRHY